MSVTMTAQSQISGPIPGFGFQAVLQFVQTAASTYTTGGDTVDLSSVFPNQVYGGRVISDTLNDGGFKSCYVLAASGAPATGICQLYWGNNNGGADGPLVEVANGTDCTAIDGQLWIFFGR